MSRALQSIDPQEDLEENVLALKGVFMRGIWPRLILMALLIPVGWRDESLAQTTAPRRPGKWMNRSSVSGS